MPIHPEVFGVHPYIRVVPDVPSNPADDELTRADEFAAASRCLDPGVPINLEDVRPLHGLGDDGGRADAVALRHAAAAKNRSLHVYVMSCGLLDRMGN